MWIAEPRQRRAVAVVVVVLASALLGAANGLLPGLERDVEGRLWLARLPPVLDGETIGRQLHNGLTTVVLIEVEMAGTMVGAARIDIRYELWEEVFLVTVRVAGSEAGELHRLADPAELSRWWGDLRLPGGTVPATSRGESARQATVTLEVVPFSQAEQLDTQRWFEESVRRAERERQAGEEGVDGDAGIERVLTTLMATSIRRRPLISYRWRVPVESGEAG